MENIKIWLERNQKSYERLIHECNEYQQLQNEIIDKLMNKSNDELIRFLDLDITDNKVANAYILRFKYNIKSALYTRR